MRVQVVKIDLLALTMLFLLTAFSGATASAQGGARRPQSFSLWDFDEESGSCRSKGRLQDKEYCQSKTMDEILAAGKGAVPILIFELTDSRPAKRPIFDYWGSMTVGDIAYFILENLFTGSDWRTFNMPGVEVKLGDCPTGAEACWHKFLKKHGRKFVQNQWLAAWNANKDRVSWDVREQCFGLTK